MGDLTQDILSQITRITKVVLRDQDIIMFLESRTDKQTIINHALFSLIDKNEVEYEHSSVFLSREQKIGLCSIIFRAEKGINIKRARKIFFYTPTDGPDGEGRVSGKYFQITRETSK